MAKAYELVTHRKFIEGIVLYNILLYALFFSIYNSIDFEKHFEITNNTHPTPAFLMYFAFLTHSNAMCAEVVPRTQFGRNLVGSHVLCSWTLFLILLAPWTSVRVPVSPSV